ncbi:MAG TPA: hypothetical protein VNS32_20515 [Flavisolibacter sp.]|nr:hypothetical protein [Flavisolibacter sp.]
MRLLKIIAFYLLLFLTGSCYAQDVSLSVVSNSKGAPQEIKLAALKSILRGEKQRWPDGTKITIALMKTNTPIGSSTCKKIYNMSGDELNKFWLALVFQGKSQAPVFFNSNAELEAFILQTPGAIGITSQPSVNIRSMTIDGKKTL